MKIYEIYTEKVFQDRLLAYQFACNFISLNSDAYFS